MDWSSCGTVWLRGRCDLPLPVAGNIRRGVCGGIATKGAAAVPKSGVKSGDVGLSGPGEKEEGAAMVKALFRDVALWEWNGPREAVYSKWLSGLSCLGESCLRALSKSRGEVGPNALGEEGGLEVWHVEMPSASSGAKEDLRDRAPVRLCFNLNFSSQIGLNT